MTEKTLTTENIKPALDALRGELAPWPVVAKKQDRLNAAQLNAANSGITSSLVAQIIANTAAIRALESAITGTGLRALVVSSLPATGTQGILYIVPVTTYDPETDADVVNYSNEYLWIPVEGGTASEGHYEQVGQTGIVINNGQLTITVNGTSVGTFTANQSGDTTAAIAVPTNADYVDLSTNQTVAGVKTFSSTINGTAAKAIADEDGTSIKTGYVNVAGNQTVTGQKTWSGNAFYTAGVYHRNNSYEIGNIPASNIVTNIYLADKNNVYTGFARSVIYASGRTATEIRAKNAFKNGVLDPTGADINANLNVEVQPDGTKSLYFDGSIRNNVLPYATNSYSLGSSSYQWSSVYAQSYYYKGTEFQSKFVTTDTQQTITGFKIFNTGLWMRTPQTIDLTTNPSSFITGNGIAIWDNANYWGSIEPQWTTGGSFRFVFGLSSFTTSETRPWTSLVIEVTSENQALNLSAFHSNANLGTSTNKWKTLNGINPGALSLPDKSKAISIDTTNLVYGSDFTFTPTASGWLFVSVTNCTRASIKTGVGEYYFNQPSGIFRDTVPVIAGEQVTLLFVSTATSAPTVTLYPCLGNV